MYAASVCVYGRLSNNFMSSSHLGEDGTPGYVAVPSGRDNIPRGAARDAWIDYYIKYNQNLISTEPSARTIPLKT